MMNCMAFLYEQYSHNSSCLNAVIVIVLLHCCLMFYEFSEDNVIVSKSANISLSVVAHRFLFEIQVFRISKICLSIDAHV